MARATHIAVNLLLVVALTMQPGLIYGLGQDCSAGITTGFRCEGCNRCNVRSEQAYCPCCSGAATKEKERSGCCEHEHQHTARLSPDDGPFAGMELLKGPEPAPAETVDSSENNPQVQAACVVMPAMACCCVTSPEPLRAPAPRSSTSELRNLLTVNGAYVGEFAASGQPPISESFEISRRPIERHFSQIAFCVWRL